MLPLRTGKLTTKTLLKNCVNPSDVSWASFYVHVIANISVLLCFMLAILF